MKKTHRRLSVGVFVLFLLCTMVRSEDTADTPFVVGGPDIRLVSDRQDPNFGSFEFVLGPDRVPAEADRTTESLQEIFPVWVGEKTDRPQVIGTYRIEANGVRFVPRYPVEPNLLHTAAILFSRFGLAEDDVPDDVERRLILTEASTPRSTVVSAVYPSGEVPENLLRIYIHFSAPMSRGDVYENVYLVGQEGNRVEQAFLELEPELWDVEARRLTILFDPGRIKRGLRPRADLGSALQAGSRYTLVIADKMEDAFGRRLKESAEISLVVGEADRVSPDPDRWTIVVPASGSLDPVEVVLDEVVDRALLERMLSVVDVNGGIISGMANAGKGGRSWVFAPDRSWESGHFSVRADVRLEDRAGNRLDGLFDQEMQPGSLPPTRSDFVSLPFTID